jgi:ubiquinone/menaquinone biosynthesis C-methylase UbiE
LAGRSPLIVGLVLAPAAAHTCPVARCVIQGGQVGFDRLRLLARTNRADTHALLDRVGVRPGWRCLDLGCGSGEVAFEVARRVGSTGQVVGIDADDAQLELVRAAAKEADVANLELQSLDILSWDLPPVYDMVYSRFVLQHLPNPTAVLSRMWAAVRPGGVLVIEDADFDALVAYPPNEGYDFYAQKYRQALVAHGGDPTIGQKLFAYFTQVGVTDIHLDVTQGMHVGSDEGKQLVLLTLRTTSPAILGDGLASSDAIARAEEMLGQFVAHPGSMIGGPRIFQLWGRRAALDATP